MIWEKNPNNAGKAIAFKDDEGNDIDVRIDLENNGTYVFMAQVSNLARANTNNIKKQIASESEV